MQWNQTSCSPLLMEVGTCQGVRHLHLEAAPLMWPELISSCRMGFGKLWLPDLAWVSQSVISRLVQRDFVTTNNDLDIHVHWLISGIGIWGRWHIRSRGTVSIVITCISIYRRVQVLRFYKRYCRSQWAWRACGEWFAECLIVEHDGFGPCLC